MECLWCGNDTVLEIEWTTLFILPKPKLICSECEQELDLLDGSRCKMCSRRSLQDMCSDCIWWTEHAARNTIEYNYSVFAYNPFIQDVITKWKYRGDYRLGDMFKTYFKQVFQTKFGSMKKDIIIVPIPLSGERFDERGFNQAKYLADFLPIETREILTRVHGEKQSKKSRGERIFANNPFFLKESLNKSAILVDDIYTTGTTLRHAAALLRENGCPKVYAFTLIRG